MTLGGQADGRGASQAVDVGGQKQRQAEAEAVEEVSGGGGSRVECSVEWKRRGRTPVPQGKLCEGVALVAAGGTAGRSGLGGGGRIGRNRSRPWASKRWP